MAEDAKEAQQVQWADDTPFGGVYQTNIDLFIISLDKILVK
jgi:hypothetical protein